MEREVYNMIAPLIETRVANLKKINYRMKVKPRTNETDDYAKADVSTTILQYIQNKSDFDSKRTRLYIGMNYAATVFGCRGGITIPVKNTQLKRKC